jgi:hypothetical protein
MGEAVEQQGSDLDWVLALAAGAVAIVAWGLLWVGASAGGRVPSSPPIASLASSVSDVRRRASGTLVWEELPTGADLSEGDAIFVPPASSATVTFRDGTRLELNENTLVALEAPLEGRTGHAVRVARGDVMGASGAAGLSLVGRSGEAHLESGSAARLAVEGGDVARVEVLQGSARLHDGREVPVSGTAEGKSGDWKIRSGWAVRLVAPGAMARVYFHGTPAPVDLRWSGSEEGARVQVSHDSTFDAPMLDVPASAGAIAFSAPGAGRYHWRVVDGSGTPQSETRPLWVVEDVPPVALSPREGEVVAAYLGRKVPFAWSHVVGIRTYEVQVADSPEFANVLYHQNVDSTSLRTDVELPEGRYFWRVRASAAERGESPWAAPRSFRLLRKPLPGTPELLDPELEVEL